MPTSKITVYRNGRPAQNVKVSLEFTGLTNMGFTKHFYTNSSGDAYVEHASSGRANIYINGSKKGSLNAPNQEVIHL